MRRECGSVAVALATATLASLGLLCPCTTQAELWTVERSVETSLETNDNYQLLPKPGRTVNALALTGTLGVSRQSENSATRLDAGLTGFALQGETGQNHVEGHITLSQTLSTPLDNFVAGWTFLQDTTFDTAQGSTDFSLGRGVRRTRSGSAGWTHLFDERTSVRTQLSAARTDYGQDLAGASDYRNAQLSSTLQYRLDEADDLSANLGHSEYRALADGTRSTTDEVSFGFSRALSEKTAVSFSLGRYRTRTSSLQAVLVCPLEASLCSAGLVPYVVAQRAGQSTSWGLQYSASYHHRLDEVTGFAFSAAREQSPSGAGVVVTSDTLSGTIDHGLAPTLNGSMAYTSSRSVFDGVTGGPRPRLQTVSISLSKSLTPDTSLQTSYLFSRSDERQSAVSAHSNAITFTLRHVWPRVEASR